MDIKKKVLLMLFDHFKFTNLCEVGGYVPVLVVAAAITRCFSLFFCFRNWIALVDGMMGIGGGEIFLFLFFILF